MPLTTYFILNNIGLAFLMVLCNYNLSSMMNNNNLFFLVIVSLEG